MKLNLDNPGEEARIEILPLIDVIFCILTFFILGAVSLTRQSAIGVDLPGASTGTPQMQEMLLVSLDPIGQLYFEQQPVSRTQLSELLIKERQANPRKLVVLYASRSARYDDVVDILDILRSIGGDRVALATLPEEPNNQNQLAPSVPPLPSLGEDFPLNDIDPDLLQPNWPPLEENTDNTNANPDSSLLNTFPYSGSSPADSNDEQTSPNDYLDELLSPSQPQTAEEE